MQTLQHKSWLNQGICNSLTDAQDLAVATQLFAEARPKLVFSGHLAWMQCGGAAKLQYFPAVPSEVEFACS